MESFAAIIFAIGFIVAGIALIYGTKKRITWLIDPDEKYWLCYSQAFIKKLFGKEFTIYWTYFLGVLFIIVSLFGIMNIIRTSIST
jgi:hypothetical protein